MCSAIVALGEAIVEAGAEQARDHAAYEARAGALEQLAADVGIVAQALAVIARRTVRS